MLDLTNASPSPSPAGGAPTPPQRALSQSASGTTWSAFDSATPHAGTVTVKRYNVRFTEYLTRNSAVLERLSRFEGRRVPGLPKLVRAGLAAGQLTMLSEGLSAEPLDQVCVDHRSGIEPAVAVEIIGQLAHALDSLHEGGLLHVDVRPAAIMVDLKTRHAQFSDWGHAVPMDGLEHPVGAIPGIAMDGVPYASAELLAGMSPQAADDVFALACVAYELLSGRHPFGRRSAADAIALGLTPDPLSNIDAPANGALMQALALRREGRLISMRGLAEVFNPKPRTYGLPALDALLRSAWNGSFMRGAAVGIAFGALIAALVLMLAGPERFAQGRNEIAPSAAVELPSSDMVSRASHGEERIAVIAADPRADDHTAASERTGTTSVMPSLTQSDSEESSPAHVIAKPSIMSAKPSASPPPVPRGSDLAGETRIIPLVLGQQAGENQKGMASNTNVRPSEVSKPVVTQATPPAQRWPAASGEATPAPKTGEGIIAAAGSRSPHAQALVSCPQCSCSGLREKRFSEGKSLSWEEANFVLNVCGG